MDENVSRNSGDESNGHIEIVEVEDGIYYDATKRENRDVCSNCGGGCPMYMATCVEKLHK